MWNSIVSVPDHCLFIYFSLSVKGCCFSFASILTVSGFVIFILGVVMFEVDCCIRMQSKLISNDQELIQSDCRLKFTLMKLTLFMRK